VLFIGNFTNGGAAFDVDLANLTKAHTHLGVRAFTSQQRCGGASGRAIWALPICMQWIVEPTGMLRIGSVLHPRESVLLTSVAPTSRPRGAMM
jgi:hypothetical protein